MTEYIIMVVGTVVSLALFYLSLRSYKLWKETKAEWLLIVIGGTMILAVIAGFVGLGKWALMFYLVIGAGGSWYFDRQKKGKLTQLSMVLSSTILLFISGFIIITTALDCENQKLREQMVENQRHYFRALGSQLADHVDASFPGGRIVLIIPPVNGNYREMLDVFEEELSGIVIAKEPGTAPEPSGLDTIYGEESADSYAEMMGTLPLTMDRINELVEAYPECDAFVTLQIALPYEFPDSEYFPDADQIEEAMKRREREADESDRLILHVRATTTKQKKVKVAPPFILISNDVRAKTDKMMEWGIVHSQIVDRVDTPYDPEHVLPESDKARFEERWLIVTPANLKSLDPIYRDRFSVGE